MNAGRSAAGAFALAAFSVGACILLGEAVLRWRLEPVDFLQPELDAHDVLPQVVRPGSAGHDAWGFRNLAVPERTDVLAIGDSQTYGVSAPRTGSWPAQLEALTGRSVYNLALGGYGPPEYLYLLEHYGSRLAPRDVVVGLYLGNDLPSSAAHARSGELPRWQLPPDTRPLGALRNWLAGHSLLYQVGKHALPALRDRAQLAFAAADAGDVIRLASGATRTAFAPEVRLSALDLARDEVALGLAHTLELLDALAELCSGLGTRCLVALLPTKESVYAELAARSLTGEEQRRVLAVVAAEDRLRAVLIEHLAARQQHFVDPLPSLRRALQEGVPLYPAGSDGHPSSEGYGVIAKAVAEALDGAEER